MKQDQLIKIKKYKKSDWPMVQSWWHESGEIAPFETMMPLDSSFIAEIDSIPSLAVCLYLTNTHDVAYVENFVGNPASAGPARREATVILLDHISKFANELGYKRLVCMTEKPVLKNHY